MFIYHVEEMLSSSILAIGVALAARLNHRALAISAAVNIEHICQALLLNHPYRDGYIILAA